jgi:hypothetical protein
MKVWGNAVVESLDPVGGKALGASHVSIDIRAFTWPNTHTRERLKLENFQLWGLWGDSQVEATCQMRQSQSKLTCGVSGQQKGGEVQSCLQPFSQFLARACGFRNVNNSIGYET